MAVVPQRWTVNGLSAEFSVNYRTIARRLARVAPVGKNVHGAPEYLMQDAAAAILLAADGRASATDLNLERTRLAREQADMVALKNARLRGELLDAEDVVASWENAIIRCRELLMTIPAALADEIMGMARAGDAAGVRSLLDDRIRGALAELANIQVEAEEDDDLDEPSG